MTLAFEIQRVQNAIEKSLIYSILIYPSSISILSNYLTNPIPKFQLQYFTSFFDDFSSVLMKINPLLIDDITDDEIEINTIIQEDDIDKLKMKNIHHLINLNFKDRKGISLIEKSVFFNSKKCINFLIEENVIVGRHTIDIKANKFSVGLMEYGALKGNKDMVNFCLGKGQKIQEITLILGLYGHQNNLVEWMIEEGKERNHFDATIEDKILGTGDNIEFNEKIIKMGIKSNDNRKRRKFSL